MNLVSRRLSRLLLLVLPVVIMPAVASEETHPLNRDHEKLPLVKFRSYISWGIRFKQKAKLYARYRGVSYQLLVFQSRLTWDIRTRYEIEGHLDRRQKFIYVRRIRPIGSLKQ